MKEYFCLTFLFVELMSDMKIMVKYLTNDLYLFAQTYIT